MKYRLYGCNTGNNGYRGIQSGHWVIAGRIATQKGVEDIVRFLPNRNSKDCRYDRWETDTKCAGCERMRLTDGEK